MNENKYNAEKHDKITRLLQSTPVTVSKPYSRGHAQYALEMALVRDEITREEYEELRGYAMLVMFSIQ